jgi:transposase
MQPLSIADASTIVPGLQDEIRRCEESRYDHRLHAVLLVAQGMKCPEVASLLGDAARTVEYWINRFESRGLAGLVEGERPGRPGRLTAAQIGAIGVALRKEPREARLAGTLWDGKTLSAFARSRFGVTLGVRQCQRLFRQLGFRRRKPRPMVAQADPELQRLHKKTPNACEGRQRRCVGH